MALNATGGGVIPPPTEGVFDFIMDTTAYSEPSGEGPFDFKMAV